MAGFRGKNLRSGDLAEQLGILLLQSVALVSPVPRTEDVGVDVVATLIRDFDRYKYIAEDSFFVQIKSSSVTEITFKEEQVKWLAELQLPFFIASVDRRTSTIYLYSTHYLSDVLVLNPDRSEITLELKNITDYDCTDTNSSIKVPTGPFIISWSLDTLGSYPNFIDEFYNLLKAHILIAKKSIETRRVGVVELIRWESGKKPGIFGTKIKSPDGTKEINEIIAPYFNVLLQNLVIGEDLHTTRSLYMLLERIMEQKKQFTFIDGDRKLIPYTSNLERNV